nr:retrovirus-related Pol polyprotein from transposon TNT 1-94 [Tanacetum cinerariifolium]
MVRLSHDSWSKEARSRDFQDSPDDEEDTRNSQEYLNDLKEEYQARALLAKSKRFFKKGTQRPTKDFKAKYNKVKAKLALLSSSASASKASMVKNKVKVHMALVEDNKAVSKEGAKSGKWFHEKRGTIFNSNKEVVMIAPRVRDVYVLDMTSSTQESCFFTKAFENLNWLWHKRLAHLNLKTINKLLFPRYGSTTLNNKVIVTLSNLKGHLSDSAVGTLLH